MTEPRQRPTIESIINRGVPGVDIDAELRKPHGRRDVLLNPFRKKKRTAGNRKKKKAAANKERAIRRRYRKSQKQQSPEAMATLAQSLWSKLIPGTANPMARDKEGNVVQGNIVPYASMPEKIRKGVPLEGPVVGWDVTTLTPRENALRRRLEMSGQPGFEGPGVKR